MKRIGINESFNQNDKIKLDIKNMRHKNIYNVKYWEKFYKSHKRTEASLFAKFSMEKIKNIEKGSHCKLLDICCGDGRDSVLFHSNKIETHSFDINEFNENLPNYFKYNLIDKKQNFSLKKKMDYAYCRFVLHAVTEDIEDYILINSNRILKNNGLLLIETRSDKGNIPDIIDNHYRRLSNIESLKSKLINLNFEIIHEEESSNLSPNDKENPVLIRIIAMKKTAPHPYNFRSFWETKKIIGLDKNLDKNAAEHLLKTTKLIFDFHNINFLLVFGTLLGAYRDNDFISYDTDVDIAVQKSDKNKIFDLINQGYFKLHGISVCRDSINSIGLDNNKAYIDFYFFEEIKNNLYKCDSFSLSGNSLFQISSNKIIFRGLEYSTVSNIEKYLEDRYGKNWKTPIKNKHAIN